MEATLEADDVALRRQVVGQLLVEQPRGAHRHTETVTLEVPAEELGRRPKRRVALAGVERTALGDVHADRPRGCGCGEPHQRREFRGVVPAVAVELEPSEPEQLGSEVLGQPALLRVEPGPVAPPGADAHAHAEVAERAPHDRLVDPTVAVPAFDGRHREQERHDVEVRRERVVGAFQRRPTRPHEDRRVDTLGELRDASSDEPPRVSVARNCAKQTRDLSGDRQRDAERFEPNARGGRVRHHVVDGYCDGRELLEGRAEHRIDAVPRFHG